MITLTFLNHNQKHGVHNLDQILVTFIQVLVPIVKNISDRKTVESKENTSQLLIHFRQLRFAKNSSFKLHKGYCYLFRAHL